ncbi:MAG: WD40 repeat domain-containing protein, partial [Armatimonadetes bacterium]|nr:WD40 repeat domain-containing protein [Armatimonadota bacterium]
MQPRVAESRGGRRSGVGADAPLTGAGSHSRVPARPRTHRSGAPGLMTGWLGALPVALALAAYGQRSPAPTPAPRLSLQVGHSDSITALGFGVGGRVLATASRDHTARLWMRDRDRRAPAWVVLATLSGHADLVWSAEFSPDGGLVATAGEEGTIGVWETRTGANRFFLRGHVGPVRGAAFRQAGRELLSWGLDRVIRRWDPDTGLARGDLAGHRAALSHVLPAPRGLTIASTSLDGELRLWDRNGRATVLPTQAGPVTALQFSPTGELLAVAGGREDPPRVELWRLGAGPNQTVRATRQVTLRGPAGRVTRLAVSRDGRRLAAGGGGPGETAIRAHVWDLRLLTGVHPELIGGAATPTGILRLRGSPGPLLALAFSGDGRLLAGGTEEGEVLLWDTRLPFAAGDSRLRATLNQTSGPVGTLAFAPDAPVLAAGSGSAQRSSQGDLSLWNLGGGEAGGGGQATFTTIATPPPALRPAQTVLSPDGLVLATWSEDRITRVWDRETGGLRAVLRGTRPPLLFVPGAAAAALGGVLATGGETAEAFRQEEGERFSEFTLWQCRNPEEWGRPIATFRHRAPVAAAAFAADGRGLATADQDGAIRIWTTPQVGEPWTLRMHAPPQGSTSAVAFAPDGGTVITAGGGLDTATGGAMPFSRVQVWDVARGRLRAAVPGSLGAWPSLTFSGDGRVLAVGGDRIVNNQPAGGEVKLW